MVNFAHGLSNNDTVRFEPNCFIVFVFQVRVEPKLERDSMLYTCFTPTAPSKWTVTEKTNQIAEVTVAPGQCAIVPAHRLSHIERVTLEVFMHENCPGKRKCSGACKLC
jgi:hypothetical protein